MAVVASGSTGMSMITSGGGTSTGGFSNSGGGGGGGSSFFLLLLDDVGLDRRRDHFDRPARQSGRQRPEDEHVQADDREQHHARGA